MANTLLLATSSHASLLANFMVTIAYDFTKTVTLNCQIEVPTH